MKKTEQKKKNEDLQGFRDSNNIRVSKYGKKKKDEDLEMFREKLNSKVKKTEQKKKKDDLVSFRENARNRKVTSRSMVDAEDRLRKFRERIRFGPIFICTCFHMKLFQNQIKVLQKR